MVQGLRQRIRTATALARRRRGPAARLRRAAGSRHRREAVPHEKGPVVPTSPAAQVRHQSAAGRQSAGPESADPGDGAGSTCRPRPRSIERLRAAANCRAVCPSAIDDLAQLVAHVGWSNNKAAKTLFPDNVEMARKWISGTRTSRRSTRRSSLASRWVAEFDGDARRAAGAADARSSSSSSARDAEEPA